MPCRRACHAKERAHRTSSLSTRSRVRRTLALAEISLGRSRSSVNRNSRKTRRQLVAHNRPRPGPLRGYFTRINDGRRRGETPSRLAMCAGIGQAIFSARGGPSRTGGIVHGPSARARPSAIRGEAGPGGACLRPAVDHGGGGRPRRHRRRRATGVRQSGHAARGQPPGDHQGPCAGCAHLDRRRDGHQRRHDQCHGIGDGRTALFARGERHDLRHRFPPRARSAALQRTAAGVPSRGRTSSSGTASSWEPARS